MATLDPDPLATALVIGLAAIVDEVARALVARSAFRNIMESVGCACAVSVLMACGTCESEKYQRVQ
jgi:hypothetical protein